MHLLRHKYNQFIIQETQRRYRSLRRRDKVTDHLRQIPGRAFERDGFGFKVLIGATKGRCDLTLAWQSRYNHPSRAMVLLQPSKEFWMNRTGPGSLTVEVDCPPGGAGVTSVPWSIASRFQGRKQSFDVAADVFYPTGRGQMIRYQGGIQVGTAGFDTWRTIITAAGAVGGIFVLSKPAHVQLKLPTGVEEAVDDEAPITTQLLASLPDPAGKPNKSIDPDF